MTYKKWYNKTVSFVRSIVGLFCEKTSWKVKETKIVNRFMPSLLKVLELRTKLRTLRLEVKSACHEGLPGDDATPASDSDVSYIYLVKINISLGIAHL